MGVSERIKSKWTGVLFKNSSVLCSDQNENLGYSGIPETLIVPRSDIDDGATASGEKPFPDAIRVALRLTALPGRERKTSPWTNAPSREYPPTHSDPSIRVCPQALYTLPPPPDSSGSNY